MAENVTNINPDSNAAASQTPTQMKFTKRKQFLFVKIKSKPVNTGVPGTNSRPGRKGPLMRNPEPMGWLISLVIAAVIIFLAKRYGLPVIYAVVAGVTAYVVIFGAFAIRQSKKVSRYEQREKLISSITGTQALPAQIAKKHGAIKYVKVTSKEDGKPKGPLNKYIDSTIKKRKTIEMDLRAANIRKTPYEFVKSMMIYAIFIAVIVTIMLVVLLYHFGASPVLIMISPVVGFGIYMAMFSRFMLYPTRRIRVVGKNVERDILFAARDIVVGMRSGMPLYNAMAAVSTGYGDASREFGKIIELTQLGMPIEQAMDQVSDKSQSKTFKRLMLQATVSIKAGVDVTSALQDVVDDVTEERVIDLRRYGQKLNALAMFYMLFGVIFPSMGIAVATIMSTFISIFPITYVVLIIALIFIVFIQIILLNVMKNSRPVFSM